MRTHALPAASRSLLLCALCWMLGAAHAYGAAPWTEALTRQALSSGFLTRLPPEVSVAFGLTKAKEGTEVRQLVSKSGQRVRTFNVSVARESDLVVFNVDGHTGTTVAYLVAADGKLRKAVSHQAGAEAREVAGAEARAGLAREARFWASRARQSGAP
jgi:hypothetical protein